MGGHLLEAAEGGAASLKEPAAATGLASLSSRGPGTARHAAAGLAGGLARMAAFPGRPLPTEKPPMKCHFVPQGYLRRFRNSQNLLECVDLHHPHELTRMKATKTTAQLEDWYVVRPLDEVPSLQGFPEKDLEERFQNLYETDLTPALDRLERRAITMEDKKLLARFVSIQLHRPPISRDYYRRMQAAPSDTMRTPEEELRRSGEILLGFIGTLMSGGSLEPYLLQSKWVLVRSEGGTPFITSDNPITVQKHPPNQNAFEDLRAALDELGLGMSEGEAQARQSAYCVSVSPRHVLYINTSLPRLADDLTVHPGRWDAGRVQQYNDLVFRSCLSCAYTVTKELAKDYAARYASGDISNDLFVDDPFGEAGTHSTSE